MLLKSAAAEVIQPTIPTVYAEPIDIKDCRFERQNDDILHCVNRNAEKIKADLKAAKILRRRKTRDTICYVLFAATTFFTAVGMTTVFHWILG